MRICCVRVWERSWERDALTEVGSKSEVRESLVGRSRGAKNLTDCRSEPGDAWRRGVLALTGRVIALGASDALCGLSEVVDCVCLSAA